MIRAVYPPRCIGCTAPVASEFGLCADCWRETHFIAGLVCDLCGTPLPGEDKGQAEHCDDCLTIARPWSRGRAAILYRGRGRELVLSLKHADRQDIARPAAQWMARAGAPLVARDVLVVPVPLHRLRLLARRYNQAALLARRIAQAAGADWCPDALVRRRRNASQEGLGREARFANMQGMVAAHPRRGQQITGRRVLLVDDVMTSGATFAACAEACIAAGAADVAVLALARVAKDA